MGSVNEYNVGKDQTVRIFDEFYNFELYVSSEQYDVVYSFFRSIFTSDVAAGNFTVSLFRAAKLSGEDVLTLLKQMEGQNQLEITQTLAYYLNQLRSSATLLGYGGSATPNFYASRNVLI